ncbi:Hpt domain-containing protein [Sinomonas susongensis]|uniref:Hpt domain-containing protein n=1 Tax=Sinomonas susongensis TaxID=1324851 RepID=UPI001107B67D|nr:Hpt domain-containing protein [Sinomonas susongensis]
MTAPGIPSEETGNALPLVDPTALRVLAEDVGPESAASFARDFVRIWPRRRDNLTAALKQDDYDGALDAALSLRTSSTMVGASQLAGLACELERRLRADGTAAAARLLPAVVECGERTVAVLVEDNAADDGASSPRA